MGRHARWLPAALGLCILLGLGALSPAGAGGLGDIETEFEKAITKVSPTTVVCVPAGITATKKRRAGSSSGVIITRKGLVLSDGDVGTWTEIVGSGKERKFVQHDQDEVEIRIPDLRGRGFRSYKAKVIVRERRLDTSLLQMEKPPSNLKYVSAGNSDNLKVGDFAFAMGNSFGLAGEAPPTLTAGLISGLVARTGTGEGRFELIYTSAAVNQGVNGGPLVDVEGRLIGIISGPETPWDPKTKAADRPFQFLGRVTPIERLKAFYATVPEAADMFDDASGDRTRSRKAEILETVFHETGKRAYRSVVSIEIQRKKDVKFKQMFVLARGGLRPLPRYSGPVSGILISNDGYVLTSIYNLGNTVGVVHTLPKNAPAEARFNHDLAQIEKIVVHMPDGRAAPAKIIGRHDGMGIALLKLDADGPAAKTTYAAPLLEPVPPAYYEAGRMVLSVAHPFGRERAADPLLTFGLLSKQHATDIGKPWAGQWQTDCSGTDATAGAAIVDLRGRLVGMHHVWDPGRHGRNSGISFVVPWSQIETVLDELKAGRVFLPPFLGVTWEPHADGGMLIGGVVEGAPAHRVGLKSGDIVTAIDGVEIDGIEGAKARLKGKWSGDEITLTVKRDGKTLELKVVLGSRGE